MLGDVIGEILLPTYRRLLESETIHITPAEDHLHAEIGLDRLHHLTPKALLRHAAHNAAHYSVTATTHEKHKLCEHYAKAKARCRHRVSGCCSYAHGLADLSLRSAAQILLDKATKFAHRSDDFAMPTHRELNDVVACVEAIVRHVGGTPPRALAVLKRACGARAVRGAASAPALAFVPVCGLLRVLETLRGPLRDSVDALSADRRSKSYVMEVREDGQSTTDVLALAKYLADARSGASPDVRRLLELIKIFRHVGTKAPALVTTRSVLGAAAIAIELITHFPSSPSTCSATRKLRVLSSQWETALRCTSLRGAHDSFAPLFDSAAVKRDVIALHGADASRVDCLGGAKCLTVAFGGLWPTGAAGSDCCCCFRRPRVVSSRWQRTSHSGVEVASIRSTTTTPFARHVPSAAPSTGSWRRGRV